MRSRARITGHGGDSKQPTFTRISPTSMILMQLGIVDQVKRETKPCPGQSENQTNTYT